MLHTMKINRSKLVVYFALFSQNNDIKTFRFLRRFKCLRLTCSFTVFLLILDMCLSHINYSLQHEQDVFKGHWF